MSTDRGDRLRRGIRRYRGAQILPGWVAEFEGICGATISPTQFLSLEETEAQREAFFEEVKRWAHVHYDRYCRQDELPALLGILNGIATRLGRLPVILFSDEDACIGALRTEANLVLSHVTETWALVGDDLRVVTDDLASGLCLERNFVTSAGEHFDDGVYELTVWGAFSPVPAEG